METGEEKREMRKKAGAGAVEVVHGQVVYVFCVALKIMNLKIKNVLTSKSLKNKCVSARLKIISSMRNPNDTLAGGS